MCISIVKTRASVCRNAKTSVMICRSCACRCYRARWRPPGALGVWHGFHGKNARFNQKEPTKNGDIIGLFHCFFFARWGLLDFMSVAWSSSSSSSSSSSNCDPRSTVFSVGPQPRPSMLSVPCRTSTTTIHVSVPCRTSTTTIPAQCSLPDLNHDHPRPVFPAGPQPRVSTPSVPCRTSCRKICQIECQTICQKICQIECQKICQIECQKICQKICQIDMPDRMPDRMPGRMPDRMPEDMSEYMPEDMPDRMPDRMPEEMPDRMPEDMSDRMPEDMPDRMPEDLPGRMPEDMPDRMPEHMPEDMPDRMPNRMPQDLPVRKCISVMVGITRSKVFFLWV